MEKKEKDSLEPSTTKSADKSKVSEKQRKLLQTWLKSETIEKSSSSEGEEFEDSSQELSSPTSNKCLSNLGQPSQFQEL